MSTVNTSTGVYSKMTSAEVKKFKMWQKRTIIVSMIGYALFYFVRKNISMALPFINEDLGISKSDLGLFLTLHGLIYGVSKFVNGYLGDRANARYFMVAGLLLSAAANFMFGFSSAVITLGLFWMINGWFQGMGFPPCARLLTNWVPPKELATKMSVWNTSHSIGAGLVVIFTGYVLNMNWEWTGIAAWRWAFHLPAAVAVIGAIFLWIFLRDTPRSVGLPEMNLGKTGESKDDTSSKEFRAFVRKQVFKNPAIWILSIANFFVYTVRYAVLDWGPTMLKENLNMDISNAGWSVAAFEIAGIVGMLAAGWITDKVFKGRGARYCVFAMALTGLTLIGLQVLDVHTPMWIAVVILASAGFFIYGPQALVGIAAANMATKNAAGTAVGFTGLFGYLSAILSGWGVGMMVETMGWNTTIGILIGLSFVGVFIFLLAWKFPAHGYENE